MQTIKITQVASLIKQSKKHKKTIKALKLGRINKSVVLDATPQILGMVAKVHHLVIVHNL